MKEHEVRDLASKVIAAIIRSDMSPPSRVDSLERNAFEKESERIEHEGRQAIGELAIQALTALFKIAEAQEVIANTLDAGGPFFTSQGPATLFTGKSTAPSNPPSGGSSGKPPPAKND